MLLRCTVFIITFACSFNLYASGGRPSNCSTADNKVDGEVASYTLAYGEDGHSREFTRREASPRKFQWLRNPAANVKALNRGYTNSWRGSGSGSVGCTVAMASSKYGRVYRKSGNFVLTPDFGKKRITVDTSEFLLEFKKDGDDIRDLVSGLGGKNALVNNLPNSPNNKDKGIKITNFGTSTLLFEDGETRLLIDGFFTRPSILKLIGRRNRPNTEILNSVIDNFNWTGAGSKSGALDAIITMHAHHDHAMDVPYILDRIKSSDNTVHLISDESVRNIVRGYAVSRHRDESYFDEFFSGEPDSGFQNRVHEVGSFKISLMKTRHAPIQRIADGLIGRGEHINAPIALDWTLQDFKEGDAYTALISHPKGNYLIYLGGEILYTDPLFDSAGQHVKIDTIFYSAGGSIENWEQGVGPFVSDWVMPSEAKRMIPTHWDSQFTEAENKFFGGSSGIYTEGVKLLKNALASHHSKTELRIAPVNTYWHENHNVD